MLISFINDNIIRPRLIKHGFEMNFVEMFFSLLFWGWVFGPVGTILAVPLTLVVRQLIARYGGPTGRSRPCNAIARLAPPTRG